MFVYATARSLSHPSDATFRPCVTSSSDVKIQKTLTLTVTVELEVACTLLSKLSKRSVKSFLLCIL